MDDWDRDRQLLDDAGTALGARQDLDALALDVLAAPGMAEAEADRLTVFLTTRWPSGVQALSRVRALGGQ